MIPLIFGAIALGAGITGLVAGSDGLEKLSLARKIANEAERSHRRQRQAVQSAMRAVETQAEDYGRLQLEVSAETVGRFVRLLKRLKKQSRQSEPTFWPGLSPEQFAAYQQQADSAAAAWSSLQTLGTVAGTAWAAGQGTLGLAALFGTASTGTAIGSLSGAAAWNATLAWLGGGSLAAGGGGMALGAWVLGGITVGPALMLGGFALNGKGEEALTEAWEYAAEVEVAIVKMESYVEFLGQVQRRLTELADLVNRLNQVAVQSLDALEDRIAGNRDFDMKRDGQLFQRTVLLVKALSEVLKIKVLDDQGNLQNTALSSYHQYL